jgi:LPXTG-motif cell wall-anchored protein
LGSEEGSKWYFCTIKYDKDGDELWDEPVTYHGTYKDEPWNVIAVAAATDSAANIIITGCYYVPPYSEQTDGQYMYHMAEYNCYITIKYDKDGNVVEGWPLIYDGGVYDGARAVAVDSQNNIIVTGCSQPKVEEAGGGLPGIAIAGIVIGILAAGGGGYYFWRRRRTKPTTRAEIRRKARGTAKKEEAKPVEEVVKKRPPKSKKKGG